MKIKQIILLTLIFLLLSPFVLFAELTYNYNSGITKNPNAKDTIYITIDLCPSHHINYSKELFESFIKLSQSRGETIPIAIAISGVWLLNHKKSLSEILKIEKDGYIKITWVNHSYKHYYKTNLDNGKNFLLYNQSKTKEDIKKNHDLMIKTGLTPSNFLRFPGLMSNDYLDKLFENEGYKILGASAWLNKTNGTFKGGDVILVHGNRNEEIGVKLFIKNIINGSFNNYKFGSIEDFNK